MNRTAAQKVSKILRGCPFFQVGGGSGSRILGTFDNTPGEPSRIVFQAEALQFEKDGCLVSLPYRDIETVILCGEPEELKSKLFLDFEIRSVADCFKFRVGGDPERFAESFGLYKLLVALKMPNPVI